MKPGERKTNFRVLSEHQQEIGDKWKRLSDKELQQLLSKAISTQKFRATADNYKMDKWLRELQEGSSEGLQQELDEIKQSIETLANANDPAERRRLSRELKKKLQDLENFASDQGRSAATCCGAQAYPQAA